MRTVKQIESEIKKLRKECYAIEVAARIKKNRKRIGKYYRNNDDGGGYYSVFGITEEGEQRYRSIRDDGDGDIYFRVDGIAYYDSYEDWTEITRDEFLAEWQKAMERIKQMGE